MARRNVQISVKKTGDGVTVTGNTYNDRGTKYVQKAIVLDYKGLDKKQRNVLMLAAIETLTATA